MNNFVIMITLLLTSTVYVHNNISWLKQIDPNQRLQMYLEAIENWLLNTDLSIVVIDNSGYKYEELIKKYSYLYNRLEIISFTYDKIPINDRKFLQSKRAKGHHELYAINYAINNSKLIKNTQYLIKLTARYFIPNFQNIIKNLCIENYEVISQSKKCPWLKDIYRCEVYGCHKSKIQDIFKFPSNYDELEQEITNRLNKYKKGYFPIMKLNNPILQGCGKYMTEL